jgi:maleate cis-trans isomerase
MELNGYDFYRIVPQGVGLIAVTCVVEGWKEDAYKRMLSQVEACARELSRRSCDFIIHGGAPLVLSQGKGFETKLLAQLQEITGVPCTTSIVAAMAAFRDLSATRSAVVDPYPGDLNAKMTAYLKDWGFEVASLVSLGTSFTESSIASVGDIYRAAKRAINEAKNAQAVFLARISRWSTSLKILKRTSVCRSSATLPPNCMPDSKLSACARKSPDTAN